MLMTLRHTFKFSEAQDKLTEELLAHVARWMEQHAVAIEDCLNAAKNPLAAMKLIICDEALRFLDEVRSRAEANLDYADVAAVREAISHFGNAPLGLISLLDPSAGSNTADSMEE